MPPQLRVKMYAIFWLGALVSVSPLRSPDPWLVLTNFPGKDCAWSMQIFYYDDLAGDVMTFVVFVICECRSWHASLGVGTVYEKVTHKICAYLFKYCVRGRWWSLPEACIRAKSRKMSSKVKCLWYTLRFDWLTFWLLFGHESCTKEGSIHHSIACDYQTLL
jgi:hypothetical protein